MNSLFPSRSKSSAVVTAAEMQAIETHLFDAGMPLAALMEKAGLLLSRRIMALFPLPEFPCAAVLVGPGHNGGDALVVARELWEQGYRVKLFKPIQKAKLLTNAHGTYAQHLGIEESASLADWIAADFIVDGLFGFGLTRPLSEDLVQGVDRINQSPVPVVSLDVPSGLQTDTGEVLGAAIAAEYTLCLGLWKRAIFQEKALAFIGKAELISFGVPNHDQTAVLGNAPSVQCLTAEAIASGLPQVRPASVHKYEMGALLLVCGSRQYPGAAILAAKAAQASGVGMLYVAVPESIKPLLVMQVPDAVIVGCPETEQGAIAGFPEDFKFNRISAIAIGPGLTQNASMVFEQVLAQNCPILVDADALNILAVNAPKVKLQHRQAPTILTPHWGEFQRLFPQESQSAAAQRGDRISLVLDLATQLQAVIVLKGARTLISSPHKPLKINPESTPALARGGSGDTLTGLMGGLLAQSSSCDPSEVAASAVWWHAQAATQLSRQVSQSGVDPITLINALQPWLSEHHA